MRVTFPLVPEHFAPTHPLRYKSRSEYFSSYTGPVRRALEAAGCTLEPPDSPLDYYAIGWHFPERTIWTGVCYSDYPDLRIWSDGPGLSAIFKMKYHPARTIGQLTTPIFAGGFCMAIDAGQGDTTTWLRDELPKWRRIKDDEEPKYGVFYNQGHFRRFNEEAGNYPNRRRFEEGLQHHGDWRKQWQSQSSWHDGVARHVATLNLCGNGNSIDRKVVELCAIGTCILSDRGLEDLELPWSHRFVHEENVYFIDDPEDIGPAVARLMEDHDLRWRLIDGSRDLFEHCFKPEGMGEWYLRCARSLV